MGNPGFYPNGKDSEHYGSLESRRTNSPSTSTGLSGLGINLSAVW